MQYLIVRCLEFCTFAQGNNAHADRDLKFREYEAFQGNTFVSRYKCIPK